MGDLIGLVLRLGLHRQKPGQVLRNGGAVTAGLAQEDQSLLMVVSGRTIAEPETSNHVGGLMAEWMAKLVAAMSRPAWSDSAAASRYSSALPM